MMRALTILLLALAAPLSAQSAPRVEIVTEFGTIVAELYSDKAPITVANFLQYVDAKHYDGGQFQRTVRMDNQPNDSVKIEVIQGSVAAANTARRFPAITLERTNATGLKHLDGTLSMARAGPDTATSQFFICIGAQPSLDFAGHRNLDGQGFAAFGRVLSGMDVVRKIQQSPANAQNLTPPIKILSVKRVTD